MAEERECQWCAGTGEGSVDGAKCVFCLGAGLVIEPAEVEPDTDAECYRSEEDV